MPKLLILKLLKRAITIVITITLTWVLTRTYFDNQRGLLTLWEGLGATWNYRDVGASLNECYGAPIFSPGKLRRANRNFSGWACADVGAPAAILTLNFRPDAPVSYYCTQPDGKALIGKHFNRTQIFDDIENPEHWREPQFVREICQSLDYVLSELAADHTVLLHCDAGRDRTGTMTTMLVQLAAEARGLSGEALRTAIECDYRKSQSLTPAKYGRMADFVANLGSGGVTALVVQSCGFSRERIQHSLAGFNGLRFLAKALPKY